MLHSTPDFFKTLTATNIRVWRDSFEKRALKWPGLYVTQHGPPNCWYLSIQEEHNVIYLSVNDALFVYDYSDE